MMRRNILVVDDIALNRRIIRAALKGIVDAVFYEADDGMEALEMMVRIDLDLIILDLTSPSP